MEQLDIYSIKTDEEKMKYSNRNSDSSITEKSSKKSKSKRKKANKKDGKKHKRKKKHSTTSSNNESSDSDEFEWIEKTVDDQTSFHTIQVPVDNKGGERQFERDEWMNIESFLPCSLKSDIKKRKSDIKEEDKTKMLLDKPGQSDRELNPHWKDGGNGLPQNISTRLDNQSLLDANWLKKSLRRAKEQALRDGKSLEEVAAERWGSLGTIESMIAKAEEMSNARQDKVHDRRYNNDKNNKSLVRTSYSRNRSRSRSRSRSRERSGKYMSDYSLHHMRQKRVYQRPKDNDDYNQQIVHKSNSKHIRNWKKDKEDDSKHEYKSPAFESSELLETSYKTIECAVKSVSNTNKIDRNQEGILSKAEMNKLGARIVKAEIMGDQELADQLKLQLEKARKLAARNNADMQEETVILTRTDAKGVARPVQPRSQSAQSAEKHRKKKTAETHILGERVRHFADDDKYSLHEMFEREKGRSINEDEAMFTKFTSKSTDHMDDIFEQEIARTDADAKRDKKDRMHAIREHKNLSKCMDNCWWCPDSRKMLKHMIITIDSTVCLSLPAYISLTTGHCVLTPVQHIACQLQLDEDIWERFKELKQILTKMFTSKNLYPIFFEVYKRRCRFSHMQLECIPLPKEIGESAPIYFKKALLECETEWSINKKVVDLKGKDLRRAVPNGLSYFMVEFASHPGYAHVIEDETIFPKNFAEEIIGGMLDLDCNLWRKPKKQNFDDQREKVLEFTKMWEKYNSS